MHSRNGENIKRLWLVLILSGIYMFAEVVGGLLSNSLALLADAGHMAIDTASVALGLFAFWVSRKPPNDEKTYGYYRTEILAALANGTTLVLLALWILYEAWSRMGHPQPVRGLLMGEVAFGGLAINFIGLHLTHEGGKHSLNMRGVWLHIVTDTLGSVLALLAAFLIWKFEWYLSDPLLSALLALFMLYGAWKLVAESVNVLLESCPQGIEITSIKQDILALPKIMDIHDLHVWAVATGVVMLSAHVRVEGNSDCVTLLETITSVLRKKYNIEHATIQLESQPICRSARH